MAHKKKLVALEAAAKSIGVTNSLIFDSTRRGTKEMFAKELKSRKRYYEIIQSGDNSLLDANIV